MLPPSHQPSILEITVLSAEGLDDNNCSSSLPLSLFSSRIRPFITLTKLPATHGDKTSHVYRSRVDDQGGFNPTWDQSFRVAVDSSFFSDRFASLHLQLYTKRRIVGQAQLGWCLIPASDIGLIPPGSVGYLSYRLRARDGSRGSGIINLSIKLEGSIPWISKSPSRSPTVDTRGTVIGIPVTAIRGMGDGLPNLGR